MRIKLIVAYDGSEYIGWQKQPLSHGRSIEGVLSAALSKLLREEIILHASGRTDGGVHAWGQTVHFDTSRPIPPAHIPAAVNRLLPGSIQVREAAEAAPDFHARKSACAKTYRYTLSMAPNAAWQVFGCRYFWPLGERLNLAAMEEAAAYLIGEYDFKAFSVTGRPVKSSRRTISRLSLFSREEQGFCPWQQIPKPLCIQVTGNGFLYKMVRLITARLVQVGRGKLAAGDIQKLLAGAAFPSLPPAPPQGLMLMEVEYPPENQEIGDNLDLSGLSP